MEFRQLPVSDVLYMVTLPCGAVRHLDAEFASAVSGGDFDGFSSSWQEVFPHRLHSSISQAFDEVIDQRQVSSFECQLMNASALITLKPVADASGNIIAVSFHGKPLQKARYYKSAFEHSFVAQWVIHAKPLAEVLSKYSIQKGQDLGDYINGQSEFFAEFRWQIKVIKSNPQADKLFGLSEPENFKLELVHHLTEHGLVHIAGTLLESNKQKQFFHQEITLHGEAKTFWFSCEYADEELYFTAMDISTLKTAEKSLEEREQFLAATVKAIPDYLLVYDFNDGKRVFQNRDILKDLGYDSNELEGNDSEMFSLLAHEDDTFGGEVFAKVYQFLNVGKIFETTIRLKHKCGGYRHFYFRAAPLNAKDKLRSAVVIAKDVSEALNFERSLNEKRRHYRLLADNLTDVVVTTDTLFRMNYVSPSLKSVLGYDDESFLLKSDALKILGLGEITENLAIALADSAMQITDRDSDYSEVFEAEALHSDGSVIPIEVKLSIVRDENNTLEGMLIVLRNVSERQGYEHKQLLATKVFENSMDAIYITDETGVISQVNKTFCDITGYNNEEVVGKKPSMLSSGWHDNDFSDAIVPEIVDKGQWTGELMSRRSNGEAFLAGMSITDVLSAQGESLGYITTFKDITEAKSSEENIRKLAYFDPLTALPNRMLFRDRLNQAVQRSMRNRHYIAILFLDLDGFKAVNDSYGHALGDVLLAEVARRLEGSVRGDDTVARMGGDEFTVILHALKTREQAENSAAQIASKIITVMNRPFSIQGKDIKIGTSIGVSLYPDDGNDLDELVRRADTAMYHAKKNGKNNYQFFTDDMHQRAAHRQMIEQDIYRALEKKKFVLAYQPKLDVQKQRLMGFEALLRWDHSEKGLMAPNMFLKAFDDLGLGAKVGDYVLNLACGKLKEFSEQGLSSIGISINVFARQFREANFAANVKKAISRAGVHPELLTLEFSENILMADAGVSYSILTELHELGVRISIDDFADGMFSFQNLRRLPVDEVKIDRHMLMQIDKDPDQTDFIAALINFSKDMNFSVVAEGVERSSQMQLIKAGRADLVQGFLFSKPVLEEQLDQCIQKFLLR